MAIVKDTNSFLLAAIAMHGNRYDYSLSVFTSSTDPITIICRVCGSFIMAQAESHYRKSKACGCKTCEIKSSLRRSGKYRICPSCRGWARYKDNAGRCKECQENPRKLRRDRIARRKAENACKPNRIKKTRRTCLDCGRFVTKNSVLCMACFTAQKRAIAKTRAEIREIELRQRMLELVQSKADKVAMKLANEHEIQRRKLPVAGAISWCYECGKSIVNSGFKRRKYCCINCNWRARRRTRRARNKACYEEPVDLLEIANRDKWKCQLCGKKVKRDAEYKKQATLDHVIPISKGGLHNRFNCQLAHFDCNSRKHDNVESLF